MNRTDFKTINFTRAFLACLLLLLPPPFLTPNQPFRAESPIIRAESFEQNETLQAEADALLPLFDNMPPVAVYLTDAAVLKSGSSIESGVAYTDCVEHVRPTIYIKKIFYERTNNKQLVNILKHELTHAWLCRQQMMAGHDAQFRRKFAAVGGFGN